MSNINSLNKSLKNGSLSKLVVERIKEALINKELKPGDYLPSESELVRNMGIGKSSVREAIKMLEAMGVVEVRQGNGTIIREKPEADGINTLIFQLILQQSNNQDILDLRIMFETAYTIMAMNKATDEDFEVIKSTIANYEKNISEGKQKVDDDMNFHTAILHATHNPFVIRIGETILQLFKASIEKSVKQTPEIALDDHKRIFKAFYEKNGQEVSRTILASLERWKYNI